MEATLSEQQFWNAVSILLRNYHAVNRKIFACVLARVRRISAVDFIEKFAQEVDNGWAQTKDDEDNCTAQELEACLSNVAALKESQCGGFVMEFKFLTKKLSHNIRAVGVIDVVARVYTCKFLHCDTFDDFSVRFHNSEILVEIQSRRLDAATSKRWAEFVLKPKLQKWCLSSSGAAAAGTQGQQQPPPVQQTQSLRLVDIEAYNDLYKEVKRKYAEPVLQLWNDAKESTDPLKFIYEDLAIAAYLISLWRSPAAAPPPTAFADLGCGNGLLVYVLNSEGYKGYGYDIRARKLWSFYPGGAATQLIEQAIDPDACELPFDVDWLIGNHSDELSPWLPVLAALACHKMRYFLLPCCAFELSGAKFQRRNSASSVYQDFYAYASTISQLCGFRTLQDRLKIPSTKRLALLGIERTHPPDSHEAKILEIKKFVAEQRQKHDYTATTTSIEAAGGVKVKLREREEAVRNCTQIDADVIGALVQQIFRLLLTAAAKGYEDEVNAGDDEIEEEVFWQSGGTMSMREIVTHLSHVDLKHIKAECGGIKTLLRNKHEIFEFCGNDLIGIRKPKVRKKAASDQHKPQTVKKRLCFFKQHHPQGCPLTGDQCTFIH